MIEKQLLKLLLNYEFFKENHSRLLKSMFSDGLDQLYETIVSAHSKYKTDLTEDEIFTLYKENNPVLTTAKKTNVEYLFNSLNITPKNPNIRSWCCIYWIPYFNFHIYLSHSLALQEGVHVFQ